MRIWTCLFAFAFVAPLCAQEREFTSADGRSTFRGEVIALGEEQVTVRREDGREFTFSHDLLSEVDQAWLDGILGMEENPFVTPRDPARAANANLPAAPAADAPVVADPAAPGATQPGATQPGATQPGAAQPVVPVAGRDPVSGLSATARALLTGHATATGPTVPSARRNRPIPGVQFYYDTPSTWGRWYAPNYGYGYNVPHLDWHGNHWNLHAGPYRYPGFPGHHRPHHGGYYHHGHHHHH